MTQNPFSIENYDFELPQQQIANRPTKERSNCKLLRVKQQTPQSQISHHSFKEIADLLDENDFLVFNQSYVIPARLKVKKASGGEIEIFLEKIQNPHQAWVKIKMSGKLLTDKKITVIFSQELSLKVAILKNNEGLILLEICNPNENINWKYLFEQYGQIPLPPYIKRQADNQDENNYQNLFANPNAKGSTACATAGLHFDEYCFEKLKQKGIDYAFVTLHIGLGTFQPIKTQDIRKHQIHQEDYFIDEQNYQKIQKAIKIKKKIVAVGTTSMRCLESCIDEQKNFIIESNKIYSTQIYITPNYSFKIVNKLITNFHLPKSSLLVLVSAFMSLELIKEIYQIAIDNNYRFFSYGDAMLLEPNESG